MPLKRVFWRLQAVELALAGGLALATPSRADYNVLQWNSATAEGSEVHVSTCLDHTPNRGFLPVTVTARNGLDRKRTWTLSFEAGYGAIRGDAVVKSTFPIEVPARSTTKRQFLVPLPTQFDKGRATALQAALLDPQPVASGFLQAYEHNAWTTLALAEHLGNAPGNLDQLSKEIRSSKAELPRSDPVAMLLAPNSLPPDWRALSGIDALVLRTEDWRQLSPAVRSAVRQWVRLGRHLLVLDPSGAAPPDLATGATGFGSVATLKGDALRFPVAQIRSWLEPLKSNRLADLRSDFDGSWLLAGKLGKKPFHSIFAFAILFLFAILVGPVNLFSWADSRKRHRLIFTVPLISGAASLLLIITIFLQDGFGGFGYRTGILQIFAGAEDRSACLLQEQICRTGVLAQRGFPIGAGTVLSHVLLARSRWTYYDSRFAFRSQFALFGNRWTGDWFRSRSEQGHFLEDASPTRGRIERLPTPLGDAPALVSSLDFALSTALFFDESGAPWRTTKPARPGDRLALEPCPSSESTRFLGEQAQRFSSFPARRLANIPRTNRLFALVQDPGSALIATHPGIRWREDSLLLITEPVPLSLAAHE